MNPKLKKTLTVLQISSIIYFAFALLLPILYLSFPQIIFHQAQNQQLIQMAAMFSAAFTFVFCAGLGIFVQFIIRGLKKTKYWAWIAGLIITGLYIPSLFIILGIIGILGLLDKSVIDEFQSARNRKN